MKINGVDFVMDPNKLHAPPHPGAGKPMTAGEQLFEAAYGLRSFQAKESGYIVPQPALTGLPDYDHNAMCDRTSEVKAIHQRGMGVTSPDSTQHTLLGTDGLAPCVAPIAYGTVSKIGALAHVDPPMDAKGFVNDFLAPFPSNGEEIRFDFVGGLTETPNQLARGGNDSRRQLTNILQQMHDHPDNGRFNIRSFDVMGKAHATEIVLDTDTGLIYPGVRKQGLSYDAGLDSSFREMGKKYSSAASAQLAQQLTAEGIHGVRKHFDGTNDQWLQNEQNAIARGFINDTVGMLTDQGVGVDMAQVRSAISVELNQMMNQDPEAVRGLEIMLKQGHTGAIDHTDAVLGRDTSLAKQLATSISRNPGNLNQAVKDGVKNWKSVHVDRMTTAMTTAARDGGLKAPEAESLKKALNHGMSDQEFLTVVSKMHASEVKFSQDNPLPPQKLANTVRTAECLETVGSQRRMPTTERDTLLTNVAPSLHTELSQHPTLPVKEVGKAVFDKLLDDGHVEKEQMNRKERVMDALSNQDTHKPVHLGPNPPTQTMAHSVHAGVNRVANKHALGVTDHVHGQTHAHQLH